MNLLLINMNLLVINTILLVINMYLLVINTILLVINMSLLVINMNLSSREKKFDHTAIVQISVRLLIIRIGMIRWGNIRTLLAMVKYTC